MRLQPTLVIIFCLLSALAMGQTPDLKSIKKSIPGKKVKSVIATKMHTDLFWFYTKTDTGLWNNKTQKVIASEVTDAKACRLDSNWKKIYTRNSVELWDWNKPTPLIKSSKDFRIDSVDEFDIQVVLGSEMIGIYHESKKAFYLSDLANPPKVRETLFEEKATDNWSYDIGCYRDKGTGSITWAGSTGDGWQNTVSIYPLFDNLLSVDLMDMNNHGTIYDRSTLKKQLAYDGEIQKWDSGYVAVGSYDMSYYRKDFTPVVENLALHDYEPAEFASLLGVKVDKCWHISSGAYLTKKDNKYAFVDVMNHRRLSDWYDYVHPIGANSYESASMFTVLKDNHIHFATIYGITMYAQNLNRIDILISAHGNEYKRFDDSLRVRRYVSGRWVGSNLRWTDQAYDSLTIVSHSELKQDMLVLSPRAIETPRYRNSMTKYRQGAGVLNTKSMQWKIKPLYHTITPLKGIYVASTPGNSINSWTKTEIFDQGFKRIGSQELGCHFIIKNRLTVRDENWDLVEMDPTTFKVVRKLDSWKVSYEDTKREDGFLFLGRYKSRSGYAGEMAITHIISPDVNVISRSGFSWGKYITDGLIIVNKIPKGVRLEESAILESEFESAGQAIYDLKLKKLITPWFHEIYNSFRTIDITRKKDGKKEQLKHQEIRSKFAR